VEHATKLQTCFEALKAAMVGTSSPAISSETAVTAIQLYEKMKELGTSSMFEDVDDVSTCLSRLREKNITKRREASNGDGAMYAYWTDRVNYVGRRRAPTRSKKQVMNDVDVGLLTVPIGKNQTATLTRDEAIRLKSVLDHWVET